MSGQASTSSSTPSPSRSGRAARTATAMGAGSTGSGADCRIKRVPVSRLSPSTIVLASRLSKPPLFRPTIWKYRTNGPSQNDRAFPMGEARSFWLGPFVRYFQIVGRNSGGFDNRDARTIVLGLSLETGTRLMRQSAPEPVEPAPMAVAVLAARPDRDGDGVLDDVDACPDMRGPASNAGCPIYEKVIVKPDKLELREKIQFAWNQAVIELVSYPA